MGNVGEWQHLRKLQRSPSGIYGPGPSLRAEQRAEHSRNFQLTIGAPLSAHLCASYTGLLSPRRVPSRR